MQTTAIQDLLGIFIWLSGIIPIIFIIGSIVLSIKWVKQTNKKIQGYLLIFVPLLLMFVLIWLTPETEKAMFNIQIVFMGYYLFLREKYRSKNNISTDN